MQYLYFRTRRHYSKKGSRWSAYEVKTEKSYPHVPSIMRGIIEARLGDAVGMNRKVVLERDDPRRLSATIAPIPPPPTAESIAEKRSRVSIEDMDWALIPFYHCDADFDQCYSDR